MATMLGYAVILVLVFVLIKVLILWVEPHVAFRLQRGPTPAPPPYTRFETKTSDGITLVGWRGPILEGEPVLLYVCGNAGSLADRTEMLLAAVSNGVGVVAFNYRGTGESDGRPTEKGVYRDADAIWTYLTDSLGVPAQRIVLWGHSIGGAVATELALRRPCAGLVLESTFRSAAVMARRLFFGLPIDWAMSYRFDNEGNLARLDHPVLIIHGMADQTVPVEDAPVLLAAALGPKELWLIQGGDHNDLYMVAGRSFFERIKSFVHLATTR